MRIKNLPSIESMDGSQDALVIEQTDGGEDKSRKVSPAQIKQYVLGSSIDDVYSVMGQMGAKNLIPYPYNETTQVDHGVTFTVNNDGTVIANGTANGTAELYLVLGNVSLSAVGNLVINTNKPLFLSGCPSGGSHSTFRIQYGLTDGTTYWAKTASDIGSGVKITPVDGLNTYCFVVIKIMVFNGYTANNLTFKPMLRLASDTDSTYQPYAKTNKELTDELDTAREQIAALENIKVANVSATMTVSTADVTAIGGYRSVSSTSKSLSSFTGYPTGKTVVAESLYAWGANAAILGVVHVINGTVYLNTAATGDYNVHGVVFYKD